MREGLEGEGREEGREEGNGELSEYTTRTLGVVLYSRYARMYRYTDIQMHRCQMPDSLRVPRAGGGGQRWSLPMTLRPARED